MNRRTALGIAGGMVVAGGVTAYSLSDTRSLVRGDRAATARGDSPPRPGGRRDPVARRSGGDRPQHPAVVRSAARAVPLGRRQRRELRWLPAFDPGQRQTVLSIGAFLQNLEYAAGAFGYSCDWTLLATTNRDARVVEVRLTGAASTGGPEVEAIKTRRTVRSHYSGEVLSAADVQHLVGPDRELVRYLPAGGEACSSLNEQTVAANRRQAYRDPAQRELSDWVRFSSRDAETHRDGLTTAGLDVGGAAGWVLRNRYGKADVLGTAFRERGLDRVATRVATSAGWFVIASAGDAVAALLDAGRRMQRLFLKVRARGIALHPMTQILEEPATRQGLNPAVGIDGSIQFLLRTGHLKTYPPPVSLRRPVGWFLRAQVGS